MHTKTSAPRKRSPLRSIVVAHPAATSRHSERGVRTIATIVATGVLGGRRSRSFRVARDPIATAARFRRAARNRGGIIQQ
ncbi:hypothetical protein PLANPX_2205 [Lacipirellula parvula]|uniref:Uncharacterized protein n=1 Tax=Lacipirellula parvula TaxID=2650471 RepID=A0A5K7XEC6_9BACT|nr:hypothetical protein PLANPX_2205 [Lacipirellula parvula]